MLGVVVAFVCVRLREGVCGVCVCVQTAGRSDVREGKAFSVYSRTQRPAPTSSLGLGLGDRGDTFELYFSPLRSNWIRTGATAGTYTV